MQNCVAGGSCSLRPLEVIKTPVIDDNGLQQVTDFFIVEMRRKIQISRASAAGHDETKKDLFLTPSLPSLLLFGGHLVFALQRHMTLCISDPKRKGNVCTTNIRALKAEYL